MSVGVDLSIDPVEAFLSQGTFDGYEEPETAEPHDRTAVVVAAGLLAAFALMTQVLRSTSAPATPGAAREALAGAWRTVAPVWMRMALPGIVHAFALGSTEKLTRDELEFLAKAYTESLGEYAHETSAEAMLSGFQAQLNAGWDRDLAWRRSVLGYGLDNKGMRQYVVPLLTRPTAFVGEEIPEASRRVVSMLLSRRAQRMGDAEGYHATQLGKQLVWQYLVAQGVLRQDAQKRWITKEDERVCPTCGPLDGVAILVSELFEVGGLHLLAPGVHPNCRCTLELTYPEIVGKAWNEAKAKRDPEGQFARVDTRTRVKDPDLSQAAQEVAALLARGVADAGLAMADEGLVAADMGLAQADEGLAVADAGLVEMDEGLGLDLAPEDTGFGAALRAKSKTRRVTHIHWLPQPEGPPIEEEVVEDVTVDGPSYRVHQGSATMNAAEYYSAVRNLMYSKEGSRRYMAQDESHELLNPRPGSVIDFDATGAGSRAELGDEAGTQWIPPAMKVVPNTDESDVDHIGDFVAWMDAKSDLGSVAAMQTRRYADEAANEYADEFLYGDISDLTDRLENLDTDALGALARRKGATLPYDWPELDNGERAAVIATSYEDEKIAAPGQYATGGPWESVVHAAAASYALSAQAEQYRGADMMDATANDIPPDLFVFDGWFGPAPTLVEGKYVVDRVAIKRLTINQQDALAEELVDRGAEAKFSEIRVFHLRPMEPAWFPQTPEQLRNGLPPVDY